MRGRGAAKVIETVRQAAFGLKDAGAVIEETGETWGDPGWPAGVVLSSDRGLPNRPDVSAEDVVKAREQRRAIWETFRRVLAKHDFIIAPTIQYVAPTLQAWVAGLVKPGYMNTYAAHTAAANLIGWPAMTVPAGLVDGMPVGLQIMGRPNSEARMLQLAQAFLETRA